MWQSNDGKQDTIFHKRHIFKSAPVGEVKAEIVVDKEYNRKVHTNGRVKKSVETGVLALALASLYFPFMKPLSI